MLSEEQKKQRIGRITSSIAPAVLDMDNYSSQYDALQKVRGEYVFEGNDATMRGDLLEPALQRFAAQHSGLLFKPAPFKATGEWAGDNSDGLLLRDGKVEAVIEGKTVNVHAAVAWGEPGTDDVPERVLVQAHWHLAHWPEAQVCYVPVLFETGFCFKMYELPRNPRFEAWIMERAKAWHDRHVIGDEPVPIGSGSADRNALLAKSPRNWDAMLPCNDELAALLAQRIDADKAVKGAEKDRDRIDNQLRDAIKDAEGIDAFGHGLSCTYRKNKDSTRVDWEAVASALRPPEKLIYEHTRVVPGSRVLRVAKKRANSSKASAPDEV